VFGESELFALFGQTGPVRKFSVQKLSEVSFVLETARVCQVHKIPSVLVLSGADTA